MMEIKKIYVIMFPICTFAIGVLVGLIMFGNPKPKQEPPPPIRHCVIHHYDNVEENRIEIFLDGNWWVLFQSEEKRK
jgi:hypothetical protein